MMVWTWKKMYWVWRLWNITSTVLLLCDTMSSGSLSKFECKASREGWACYFVNGHKQQSWESGKSSPFSCSSSGAAWRKTQVRSCSLQLSAVLNGSDLENQALAVISLNSGDTPPVVRCFVIQGLIVTVGEIDMTALYHTVVSVLGNWLGLLYLGCSLHHRAIAWPCMIVQPLPVTACQCHNLHQRKSHILHSDSEGFSQTYCLLKSGKSRFLLLDSNHCETQVWC